jgi:hypothetical protein
MSRPAIFLFSGHMIDARGRREPRFPPNREGLAAAAIDGALTEFGAVAGDVGITEGACGGDLLFAEDMLRREARLELHLPFPEEEFVRQSVAFEKSGGMDNWRERFWAVRRHPRVRVHVMPEELGPLPKGADPYERCNEWMVSEALESAGDDELRFIALWDGGGGDGPGGTAHMMNEVKRHGGQTRWLNTRVLWPQVAPEARS